MDTQTQRVASAAELVIKRREIRRSFFAWCTHALPEGQAPTAAHHRLIIQKLQDVSDGKIKRLMIFLPPGSAKSTYGSVLFAPWYLAQRAGSTILSCSHSADLASSFGRKCRNLIDLEYKTLGYALSKDSKAADNWETTTRCGYLAAGVGAGIAGRRADLGVIDDPIGKKEDAESEQQRQKTWDWYVTDFRPRLKPNAAVVLIMTRWNEDDLAGRLLEREASEWEVVHIKFIADQNDVLGRRPGELLWPEWYNEQSVKDARKDSRVFSALYQGEPSPPEGDFFKSSMLCGYEPQDLPRDLRFYGASDHSVGQKQHNDLNCLGCVGVDSADNVWVLPDLWWQQGPTDATVEAMIDLMLRYKPVVWRAEADHIKKAIGPFLAKRQRERKCYVYVEEASCAKDKLQRAQSIHGRMSMSKVFFPKFASWWSDAEHQLLTFPNGKHDDFVDWLAHIGNSLSEMLGASVPVKGARVYPALTYGWLVKSDRQKRIAAELSKLGY